MTRLILLLALFSFKQTIFGQVAKPTKSQLSDIFKASIHQDSKRKIQTELGQWLICNKDSSFFKSDTMYLYDNQNYTYQNDNCCDFVSWTFYKSNAIVQKEIQICNEPPTAKAITDKDFYTIKLVTENNFTIMKVYRKTQLVDTFIAIAFDTVSLSQKGQTSHRLTLVRQRQEE